MAFKKSDGEFKYNIECILGNLKESDKHDWIKCLMRVSWGDNPAMLDVRNINLNTNRIGKGVSLTNEEADRLTDLLLENDFGSMGELERAIKRRKDIFSVSDSVDMMATENGDYYKIDINLEEE